MKRVALLLDDEQNLYQQLLVREARTAAEALGARLLEPEFAAGSSWHQVEAVNRLLRAQELPDALLVMLAGGQPMKGTYERVARAGIPLVLLNRIPDWIDELRGRFPEALLAAVTPDQAGIGRIQAQQALRLARESAFVLLLTGTTATAAAAGRRDGFLEGVADRLKVHSIEGDWSAPGAGRALSAWFRLGADRDRTPALIVCHNDAMAEGARAELLRQAASAGDAALARVPLVGCDGLAEEGRARVGRGELAATVVLPPSTPRALEIVQRHWSAGGREGTVLLEGSSFPPLDALRSA